MEKNHKYVPGKKIIIYTGILGKIEKKSFLCAQLINI